VASPDPTHVELVLACLEAGKPVLCEKPLAPTAKECLEVVAAETALGRRLVQTGFMRRFDPCYGAMRDAVVEGRLGLPVFLHCAHRNASVPAWFDPAMVITNSAVHEIDTARWLLDDEIASATVLMRGRGGAPGPTDRQFIVLETERGTLVDVELLLNARYGYDVTAELVCETGTVSLVPQAPVAIREAGQNRFAYAGDWRAHFAAAYRAQLQAWVDAVRSGGIAKIGASAWDGYVASAAAGACLASLADGGRVALDLAPRPDLYR
jgi:myo-inositol 2-dehydrogenase/D-chiro-inositol 1-dehydrogenase